MSLLAQLTAYCLLPSAYCPVAQANRVEEMARHMADGFREDAVRCGEGYWWMVVVIAVVGLLVAKWTLDWRTGRSQGRAARNSPKTLFVDLCRQHGLTLGDRRLLWRLARFQDLDSPGRLFLEPERFDSAVLDPEEPGGQSRYQMLRARLFAGLDVNTSP